MSEKQTTGQINHPKFAHMMRMGESDIACFTFGRIERPDQKAQEAFARVAAVMRTIDPSDIAAIREWQGSVHLDAMYSREVNPEITEADIAECERATAEAFPGMRIVESWRNNSQGLDGVSVRITKTTGATP